jgi:hypothetical protein
MYLLHSSKAKCKKAQGKRHAQKQRTKKGNMYHLDNNNLLLTDYTTL